MKETTPEEVLKVMRHDNKKLDEQLDELEALRANLRKANELISGAVIRMPDISYSVGMGMTEKDTLKGNLQRGLIMKRSPCGKLMVSTEQISMDELTEGEA